jgi:ABC-type glycerol-3-phosphate transport system substrate-binding protein
MFKRASLVLLLVLLVMVAMLFSLSTVGIRAQDATVAPTNTPIVAEIGQAGGLHLSFWNGLTGSDGVTLNDMLTVFAKENPNISVTVEMIDWNTFYPKLQAAFVAGEPPDIILYHASEIPEYASKGLIRDLSDWYDTNGGPLPAKDFAQPGFDGAIVDGKIYGVQLDNHGRGAWINVGMFEKAGLDPDKPPTTKEETIALFQKLTLDKNGKNAADPAFDKANVVQWGTATEWAYVDWSAYIHSYGGALTSDDVKTATVNSQAGIDALQAMHDLIYKYNVMPAPAGFDGWQSWAGGKVAVLPTGTWFLNFATAQKDIKSKAWPMIVLGPKPATWFGAHTFALPATLEGEKLEAAKKMLLWVTDRQQDWAASGQPPARISVQEKLDPAKYPSNVLIGKTFREYGFMDPRTTAWQEVRAALEPELSAALNNQKPVKQALDDANARIQAILDRANQ